MAEYDKFDDDENESDVKENEKNFFGLIGA